MLNGRTILDVFVAALQTNEDLVSAMAGDPNRIYGFYYVYGQDPTQKLSVQKMLPPSMEVFWTDTLGGNFDGAHIWKHHLSAVVRMQNAQTQDTPVTYSDIWTYICNSPVLGLVNIRYTSLLPNLDIMDTPSVSMAKDAGQNDFMVCSFVFPEIGDEI